MAQYSKVGHVEKMFGQNFSIVTTNAAGSDMLNFDQTDDQSFISASLIIASPGDDNGRDYGTPSLLVTDYEGRPLRLTYTIKPGNGLVLGYTYSAGNSDSLDTLSFAIDGDSIKCDKTTGYIFASGTGLIEDSHYLQASTKNDLDVNINSLVDNTRLKVYNASDHQRICIDGREMIDNVTLTYSDVTGSSVNAGFIGQKLKVNLENIVDGSTIAVATKNNKRVLQVNSDFLTPASTTKAGVVKIDGSTVKMNGNNQLYVDAANIKAVTNKGGKGVVSVQAQGVGDIHVDNAGILRTNPYKMPKCGVEDSSKEYRGFGVCAVDGITIKASQNGVLSVISQALDNATSTKNGVVRPDNSTIKIQKSGVISVSTQQLTKGSAAEYGIVKYDNKSITVNKQGQLTVTNASQWDSSIADILTKISGYSQQIAALESKLVEFMATVTTKTSIPFKAYINNGVDLKTIAVHIPNLTGNNTGTSEWDLTTLNKSWTINYGAGYTFRYNITSNNSSSWLVGSKLKVNGVSYSPDSDIKLTSNSATATLSFTIQGYGTNKTQRPEGVFNVTFSDGNGQPLKIITLYIHSCLNVRTNSGFKCTLNGSPYSSAKVSVSVNSTSLSKMINTIQPTPAIGIKVPSVNTGLVKASVTLTSSK